MMTGRYWAFHVYNSADGSYINEETNENRMEILRLRDEYLAMGLTVVGDPARDDSLFELSTGPLFDTPMDYNEALED
jgi:hypothetical protein